MTKTGGALQTVKEDAVKRGEGAIRYRTICCGLKKAARSPAVADMLRSYAVDVGICKRVVTLVANEAILDDSDGPIQVRDWFLWYTQVWSAIDICFGATGLKSSNPMLPRVRKIMDAHPEVLEQVQGTYTVCATLMRNRECDALATATVEHLRSFPSRLERYLRVAATQILWDERGDTSHATKVARMMWGCVLAKDGDTEKLTTGLTSLLGECDLVDILVCHAEEERKELGALVESDGESNWYRLTSKRKNKEKDATSGGHECEEECKNVAAILPHLIRYSNYMSKVQHDEFHCDDGPPPLVHSEEEDEDDDYECMEESSEERCQPCSTPRRNKWSRDTVPRPFSALPLSKLRPCMALFTWTEVNSLYGRIHEIEKAEWRSRQGKKRKRESSDANVDATSCPARFVPDKVDFAKTLFKDRFGVDRRDALPISLTRGEEWVLVSFRTDGVQLCLSFASAGNALVHGVGELVEKGYTGIGIAAAVDPKPTERGIYRLLQTEGSIETANRAFDVVCIDPGICKPVQFARVPATTNASRPREIVEAAHFGHIGCDEWIRRSGRLGQQEFEERRRRRNEPYALAIDAFSTFVKRTCVKSMFHEYVSCAFATLRVCAAELCQRGRSLQRWLTSRRKQSFLSSVANRLVQDGSSRFRNKRLVAPLLRPEEIEDLKTRIRSRISMLSLIRSGGATEEHRVVFFGDGTFGHSRGCPPIPKKSLLHELGTRATTFLIDEYKTSCKCPCGRDLITSKGAHRVRVHKDGGGDCDVLQSGVCDRDELATVNITMSALACVEGASWPTHLKRPPRKKEDNTVKH